MANTKQSWNGASFWSNFIFFINTQNLQSSKFLPATGGKSHRGPENMLSAQVCRYSPLSDRGGEVAFIAVPVHVASSLWPRDSLSSSSSHAQFSIFYYIYMSTVMFTPDSTMEATLKKHAVNTVTVILDS